MKPQSPLSEEDWKTMATSLQTQKKLVERVTALGLSWDTAVQLLLIQGLTEVHSALERYSSLVLGSRARPSGQNETPSWSDTYNAGRGNSEASGDGIDPKPARGRPKKGTPRRGKASSDQEVPE